MRPPIQPGVLILIEDFDRRDRPVRIGSHFRQHLLQTCRQVSDVKARKRLSGARCAEKQPVTDPKEEEREVPDGAVGGVCRGGRNATKLQGQSGRDEIDTDSVRCLSQAANAAFTVELVHREPLMLQHFPDLYVDVLTKSGDRCLRSRLQDQRHNPGEHPRERLRLGTHSPADREIERHLRTASRPCMHQQRACRCGDRIAADAQLFGQPLHAADGGRIQLN
ncbi:hypothetical protein MYSE111917_17295 [Mycobacterium senriense]